MFLKKMKSRRSLLRTVPALSAVVVTLLLAAGCSSMTGSMAGPMAMRPIGMVGLAGANEVPPAPSTGTGSGTITVAPDKSISGSVTTTGVAGTMAHIHLAAKGANGPVIIALAKTSEGVWSVPAGTKLTDAQYASYVAGDLYVNVHSAAYPGGEIRSQISSN